MKFESIRAHRSIGLGSSVFLLLWILTFTTAWADAVSDLAAFSIFDKVDLVQLAKSDVRTAHGPPMSNPRFLSVQSCYASPGARARQTEHHAPSDSKRHRQQQ